MKAKQSKTRTGSSYIVSSVNGKNSKPKNKTSSTARSFGGALAAGIPVILLPADSKLTAEQKLQLLAILEGAR